MSVMTQRRTSRAATRLGRRATTDAALRQGAGCLLWLMLLLVTYWWVADGGVGDLDGAASTLTSIGRLSGLVASVLLLAQVVLMARLPFLEAAFGQDRLARQHRLVGFTSFNLMLLHIVTITLGYSDVRFSQLPTTAWDLTTDYPGLLLSIAGTVCLCMVVLTSVRAARRRLRYESWHLLHLYAYLGVGLALPHQLWAGQQFTASPWRTVFWWSAWAVTAAAVMIWRVALPVFRSLRHSVRVTAVVPEAEGIVSVYLTGRHLGSLPIEAGQFLTWRFLTGRGWSRAHPYSISAAPDGRSLRISVRDLGDGSALVRHLRPGTRALVEGPYGRLSARTRTRRRVALIGAGVGITPLRALAEGLDYGPGEAVLLQRFTTEPLFAGELDALARDRGLGVLYLPGRRRAPDSWLGPGVDHLDDTAALRSWIPDIADRDVYVCGPTEWTDVVRATLARAGVESDHLHYETFAW